MVVGRAAAARLFVAINLPEAVRRRLADAQREVAAAGVAVRWVRPEGIHVTLAFLGATEASRVPGVEAAVAGTAARSGPLGLEVRGLGCFPAGPGRAPRVVWAGLRGDVAALAALQRELATALREAGIALENERFTPHATLGRVPTAPSGADAGRLRAVLAARTERVYSAWTAESVEVMASHLRPGGSMYAVVASAQLGAGRRRG